MPIHNVGLTPSKVVTLTYSSDANPLPDNFTHSAVQGSSGSGVNIDAVNVVKTKTSRGRCHVRIYGHASYWGRDDTINVTLPIGTLSEAFIAQKRAIRDELNVSAYVIVTSTEDQLSFNRDNDITGNSPFYFEVEGIGDW